MPVSLMHFSHGCRRKVEPAEFRAASFRAVTLHRSSYPGPSIGRVRGATYDLVA